MIVYFTHVVKLTDETKYRRNTCVIGIYEKQGTGNKIGEQKIHSYLLNGYNRPRDNGKRNRTKKRFK